MQWQYDVANAALRHYDLPPESTLRLLNHSENTTYLVENPGSESKLILRMNRPGYHSRETLYAELLWLDALMQDSPIITADSLTGKNGERIQEVAHSKILGKRHCVMFSFLSGAAPDEKNEASLIVEFEKLGEITAHLHEHVLRWRQSRQLCRPVWNFDTMLGNMPCWGRWQDGFGMTPERIQLFTRLAGVIQKRLMQFGKSWDRFGLIHADLRLANLLVDKSDVKVIDFDDCGFGWFLYDLGAALSFIEHKAYVPDLIAAWLKGYRLIRPLSQDEENEIPTFIVLRRLLLVAWMGSRSDTETARELGSGYSDDTVVLADRYLTNFA